MRVLRSLTALLIVAAGVLAAMCILPVRMATDTVEFSIAPGSTLRSAVRQMTEAGVAVVPWHFNVMARLTSASTSIKAGSYAVSSGATPWEILRKITSGDYSQVEIVLIEGWTLKQARAALDAHPQVRHDTAGLDDDALMRRLGADGQNAEGWFFPDTYLFGKGESDLNILGRAHRAMKKHLESVWTQKAQNLPLKSPYEVLIMASIIEKETGRNEDRGKIAAVFMNRLIAGMRLQTDPTVIYGLGEAFDGNLRKRDLLRDTPHNTYTRPGLPPTPIALPGLASLRAAVNPEASDALYFVARGDGTSEFSRTLAQHNMAVNRYQRAGVGR